VVSSLVETRQVRNQRARLTAGNQGEAATRNRATNPQTLQLRTDIQQLDLISQQCPG
jgi:hypothetical protein